MRLRRHTVGIVGGAVRSDEISILLRDRVPSRTIVYPVAAQQLNDVLRETVPLDSVGLFFLYDSCAQPSHYDPAKSELQRYPVMALQRGLPSVRVPILAGDLEQRPDAPSILVFPVKARLKQMVLDALRADGIRPVLRWLTAKPVPGSPQRPLVLIYDETTQRVTAKFAEDWDGPERERVFV